MKLEELTKILNKEAGICSCPICATPFKPYNSRQKTCGNSECRRVYHVRHVSEKNKEKRRQNPEAYKDAKREQMRKYRRKQKVIENMAEIEAYWEEKAKVNENVTGLDYGKRQAEKILASVPKIDVNIERSEK